MECLNKTIFYVHQIGQWQKHHVHTILYDTRWYFNVRSKADISRLNLPHGNVPTCSEKCTLYKPQNKRYSFLCCKSNCIKITKIFKTNTYENFKIYKLNLTEMS